MRAVVSVLAAALVCIPLIALATPGAMPPQEPSAEIERRQEAQRSRTQASAVDRPALLSPADEALPILDLASLPAETPCFHVHTVALRGEAGGAHPFGWLTSKLETVQGQCIGKHAIAAIQTAANTALIERGFITSRVFVPEQSVASGVLVLSVIPGRVSSVRGSGIGWFRAVLPFYPGAVYNQRDVDQALESVRRLAGQGDTVLDVAPGDAPGESIIVVKRGQPDDALPLYATKRWHATVGIDNYGLDSTGRYSLTGTFSFDSPLRLYDQLTVSGSTNADWQSHGNASRAAAVNWNVPLGYASFFVNASRSRYLQSVAGFEEPLVYSGDSAELNAGLAFVPYRRASARTVAQLKLYRRYNHAYLNGESIDYQDRDLVGYEATLVQTQYIGPAVLSAGARRFLA